MEDGGRDGKLGGCTRWMYVNGYTGRPTHARARTRPLERPPLRDRAHQRTPGFVESARLPSRSPRFGTPDRLCPFGLPSLAPWTTTGLDWPRVNLGWTRPQHGAA